MKKVSINYKHYYNNFCLNGARPGNRDNRNLRNGFTSLESADYYATLSYFGILHKPKDSDILEVVETMTSCREVLAKQWYLHALGSYNLIRSNTNPSYQNVPSSFKAIEFGEDKDLFLAISFSRKNFNRFSENIKLLTKLERSLKAETSKFMVEDFDDSTTRDIDYITVAIKVSKYWERSTILFSIFTLLLRDLTWIITKDIKLKDLFSGSFMYIRGFNYKSTNLKSFIDQKCIDLRKFLKNSDYILGNEPHTGINDDSLKSLYTQKTEEYLRPRIGEYAVYKKLAKLNRNTTLKHSLESAYYNGIMALNRYYYTQLLDCGKNKEICIFTGTPLNYGLLWLLRYEQVLEMEKSVKNVREEKRSVHKERTVSVV